MALETTMEPRPRNTKKDGPDWALRVAVSIGVAVMFLMLFLEKNAEVRRLNKEITTLNMEAIQRGYAEPVEVEGTWKIQWKKE